MSNLKVSLEVIPEPAPNSRKILIIDPPEIRFFLDSGNVNYLCGKCNAVLAEGIFQNTIGNMVLKCNNCGSFNDTPALKLPRSSY